MLQIETGRPLAHDLLYPSVRAFASFLLRALWRLEVRGLENVPLTGPLIVAPNHRSYADPPITGVGLPREGHFLAKKELFSFPPFGWFITQINAHPLNRAGGVSALREAARILKRGGALIVFPEGHRVGATAFGEPKAGVGMLALSTKTPVLPVYIHNSGFMSRFRKVIVTFGAPVSPEGFDSYQRLAEEVMVRIRTMAADFDPGN